MKLFNKIILAGVLLAVVSQPVMANGQQVACRVVQGIVSLAAAYGLGTWAYRKAAAVPEADRIAKWAGIMNEHVADHVARRNPSGTKLGLDLSLKLFDAVQESRLSREEQSRRAEERRKFYEDQRNQRNARIAQATTRWRMAVGNAQEQAQFRSEEANDDMKAGFGFAVIGAAVTALLWEAAAHAIGCRA